MLGRESGVADSSPACVEEAGEGVGIGTGMGLAGGRLGVVTEFGLTEGEDEPEEDADDWRGGDCDRETARAWTAFSTFLELLFYAMKKQ